MDFWIIRDGEKAGPIPDYEIRSKLEAGELQASDPAWCDGMSGWLPLSEISAFAGHFEKPEPEPAPPPLPVYVMPTVARFPVWRRFWARWFDLHVYGAVWWTLLWLTGQDLRAISPWLIFFHLLPWFFVETVLIHMFATTPGKYFLGIRVFNLDGSHLTLGQSLNRAMRVYMAGIGLGFDILAAICMGANFVVSRKLGVTLWDRSGGHFVRYGEPAAWKIVVLAMLFIAALQIESLILTPLLLEKNPWLREFYEKSQPPQDPNKL